MQGQGHEKQRSEGVRRPYKPQKPTEQAPPSWGSEATCYETVQVYCFEADCDNATADWKRLASYRPRPDAKLSISGEAAEQPQTYGPALASEGRATFEVIEGFRVEKITSDLEGQEFTAVSAQHPEDSRRWLYVLRPQPCKIRIRAFVRERGCGDAEERKLEGRIKILYSQEGEPRCEHHVCDGEGEIEIHCPNKLVRIECEREISYRGCTLVAEQYQFLTACSASTECAEVRLSYTLARSRLRFAALQRDAQSNLTPLNEPVMLDLTPTGGGPGTKLPVPRGVTAELELANETRASAYVVRVHNPAGYRLVADPLIEETAIVPQPGATISTNLVFERVVASRQVVVRDRTGALKSNLVVLVGEGKDTLRMTTDAQGSFTVPIASTDPRKLKIEVPLQLSGNTKVFAKATEFSLAGGATATAEIAVTVEEEAHRIFGTVFAADGITPIPHAVVDVWDDGDQLVDQVTADEDGSYQFMPDTAGTFYVGLATEGGVPLQRYKVEVASEISQNIVQGGGAGGATARTRGSGAAVQGLSQAVEQISAFPLQTEPVSVEVTSTGGTGTTAPGGLRQTVEGALREVLAWQGRTDDPKGFVSALKTAFTCEQVQGRRQCRWTPRSYAVTTDLGSAVTGAQASIYTRAKVALDSAVPLLDGLYPLKTDADEENTRALRAIVRGEFTELVNELGQEGGPRVGRVDALLDLLLGDGAATATIAATADTVEGQLAQLRDEFGFADEDVNTVEEEQDLTNFQIVVDYISGIQQSWRAQRDYFLRSFLFNENGQSVFLGTQLVYISRGLAVVAESVSELKRALNSVFLGSAERQTTELKFRDHASLFIAELLDWVERFATIEGPRLVQEGGKRGVGAFYPTIEELVTLVGQARLKTGNIASVNDGNQEATQVPASYASARTQRALQELFEQLNNLEAFAHPYKNTGA